MNNKMHHRGPMDRLTTFTRMHIFTASIFIMVQFQNSNALPTASSSVDNTRIETEQLGIYAPAFPASSYGVAGLYSSYRPGLIPYRPYSPEKIENLHIQSDKVDSAHPNSVYSRQSSSSLPNSLSQDVGQELKYTGKEYLVGDDDVNSNVDKYQGKAFPEKHFSNEKTILEKDNKGISSVPQISTTISAVKPQLSPLSSEINKPVVINQENDKETSPEYAAVQPAALKQNVELPFPPPFAPELDPEYERRKYGLGPISLLDQAGPFW